VAATLSELTASARRLALVGLAKNTGKTVALAALLRELREGGRTVGVTSVGRDGEEHDVIDFRIEKPAVELAAGSLVATTDGLLRASGLPHETLQRTAVRTPLGEVLIARLNGGGTIEVAGPSAASDVRRISDEMLAAGAEQVLIDGAIDRRAASSPDVADALVMSTGAILSEDIEEVLERTRDAVELVRLEPLATDTPEGRRLRELAGEEQSSMVDADLQSHPFPPRFVLTAEPPVIEDFLRSGVAPRWLLVSGALPEAFLHGLTSFVRRTRLPLTVVAGDPTRVFLSQRSVEHYRRAGIELAVLRGIDLRALTVNPVAPESHSFDSARLRSLLSRQIADLPIFDVLHPSYMGAHPPGAHPPGAHPPGAHPPAQPPSERTARRPARSASIPEEAG
jgi:hypothetical protein